MWVFSPESRIAARYNASEALPEGVARTYVRLLEQQGLEGGPFLRVYPAAVPDVLVVRSPFGSKGTIFMSQGLISLMSEEELRAVLLACLSRATDPDLGFQSFCAEVASTVLDLTPSSWRDSVLAGKWASEGSSSSLSVRGALLFWCLWPIARAVQAMGGVGSIRGDGQAWDLALGKMSRYRGMGMHAGLSRLSLLNHVEVS